LKPTVEHFLQRGKASLEGRSAGRLPHVQGRVGPGARGWPRLRGPARRRAGDPDLGRQGTASPRTRSPSSRSRSRS
jgi:hypothetical protein